MSHPVAPGKEGFNLLSKRHLFRIVLLLGSLEDEIHPIAGPLVIESEDGSYYVEHDFETALQDGDHLVFDTYLKDRNKKYSWYFKDQARGRFPWKSVPMRLVHLKEASKNERTNAQ